MRVSGEKRVVFGEDGVLFPVEQCEGDCFHPCGAAFRIGYDEDVGILSFKVLLR